jgi:DNA primase
MKNPDQSGMSFSPAAHFPNGAHHAPSPGSAVSGADAPAVSSSPPQPPVEKTSVSPQKLLPSTAARGDRSPLEALKNRIGLLDYLSTYQWEPCWPTARHGQVAGLCPLHTETQPSFWIHTRKNLFYCHGCGRGGDLIRLVELFHGMSFAQALAHLRQLTGSVGLLEDAIAFYQAQLPCSPEATSYLAQRGIQDRRLIQAMRIGYAPGACLRAHLSGLGYALDALRQSGLVDLQGRDTLYRRIVFPCDGTLYGRSLGPAARHRFLRGGKGGLYAWNTLHAADSIVLVEGLFDVAALWQAGIGNTTCGGGSQLNRTQLEQLTTGSRIIRIAFDADTAGQRAASVLGAALRDAGLPARSVVLPTGHDPASYFAAGATAQQFRALPGYLP